MQTYLQWWCLHDGGRFSPDPMEMKDAANECKHGNVPDEGCDKGCFNPDREVIEIISAQP